MTAPAHPTPDAPTATTAPESAQQAAEAAETPGRYDFGKRRQSKRSGREKGCWVYVPADELKAAGIDPDGPAPWYRTWGTPRGGVFLRLYKSP